MKLGELIKEYRFIKKLGSRDVAKEIGFSHSTLTRFENGKSISGDDLVKIFKWITG